MNEEGLWDEENNEGSWGDDEETSDEGTWDSEEEGSWGSDEESGAEESASSVGGEESTDEELLTNENVDSGEELSSIQLDKGSFTIDIATISISDIVIPTPVKDSRRETYLGLSRSVEELGVLNPIHVMISEGYAEYVAENGSGEGYDGPKYILLDGLRRIFALKKNNVDRINAVIYDFKDKEKGSEMLNILSLILNKNQKKSWSEVWYLQQVLEAESILPPNDVEYLLQMEPGDAMKLKEVMTRSTEFPQPSEDLLNNKKTLGQAYNALIKLLKEQDLLSKEDVSGVSELEQSNGVVDKEVGAKLSDEEVKEILDMEGNFSGELSDDDFDELMGNNVPDERQKVGERHPIDPALKAETLMRDGYKCTCCGAGEYLPMRYKMAILQSHHKISVANGGPDIADNIASLCVTCHTLVHSLIWSGLKFGMSREDFDNLPEEEKEKLKNVMRLARTDVEAAKRLGKESGDRLSKGIKKSTFRMPGMDMVENANAVKEYNGGKSDS